MITQAYNLNLIPDYGSVPVVVHVSQFDSGARTLKFNLLNGDLPFIPSAGATITIEGTKPDGHSFSYICTASGSQVSADVTLQMCACAGNTLCELRILDNSGILGTANFILCVEVAGMSENPDMSDTDLPAIITLATRQMEAAAASADEAEASATEAESYAKGGTGSRTGENADNAKYYSQQAAQSAEEAAGGGSSARAYATLAESWAKGGTGSREGENTNNSKYYSEQSSDSATASAGSASNSASSATEAESYAKGGTNSRTGEDTDNAKYYSEQASDSATAAAGSASDAATSERNAASSESNAAASESEAKSAGVRAALSEAAAAGSANDSLTHARLSESWAVGERNGVPVPSTDDTYENNSKYYAGQAATSAETAEEYAGDVADIKTEITSMIGQVLFFVDYTTGNLMYTDDNPYSFQINTTTGNLEWEVISA